MSRVKSVLNRYLYVEPGVPQNFLVWPFLLITAGLAVAYTFFGHTNSVESSILHALTTAKFGMVATSAWGLISLIVVVISTANIYYRHKLTGLIVTQAGVAIWLYAFILYAMEQYWLQVAVFAIPNMMFWAWWYKVVKNYHKNVDSPAEPVVE